MVPKLEGCGSEVLVVGNSKSFLFGMDVLLYHSAPYPVPLQVVERRPSSSLLQPSVEIRHQMLCGFSICTCRSISTSFGKHHSVKNTYHQEASWSFNRVNTNRNLKVVPLSALNETLTGPVVREGQDLEDISDTVNSVRKVLIPGLPNESRGDSGASISSYVWEWKPKLTVYYEKAGSDNVDAPALLFLPGFGAGSFHYEKQLRDLGRDFRVYALDFLGQGKSLPNEDPAPWSGEVTVSGQLDQTWGFGDTPEPWAEELVYSVDLWRDQVQYFIEQIIEEPVYVVGNSLGGYVATYVAANSPQLVKGVTLLNATPFWGFLPNPIKSPLLARMFPWSGTFPLPANVIKFTKIIWQKMSDPENIANLLRQVYADHTTDVDEVFSQIIGTTQHPAAAAAFASIMCAPAGQLSFDESISRCRENEVPICLMYGKEDPWVTPLWGHQVKRQLPDAPYYEISPAGHCPHDEVPEVINYLLRGWIGSLESKGNVTLPLLDETQTVQFDLSRDVEFIKQESKKMVRVRFFGSKFSLLNLIWSRIKTGLQLLGMTPQY